MRYQTYFWFDFKFCAWSSK